MKKLLTVIFAICPMIASADYLDDKIANLTKQKLDKIAKMQECQKNTKGLKIAGITTLGVSAIGIGANIGEAVALNKLDDKIDTAVKTKSSLDTEIGKLKQPVKDAAPQQNWADCGEQSLCTNKEMFLGAAYGAVEAICVNGAWKIGGCESGLISTNQQYCVINNTPVPYYDACELANPGQDPANTCGVRTCNADAASQSDLDDLNAKEAICINGVWEAKICKDNFAGTEMTCTKNGQTVAYFKDCNPVVPGTVEKSCDAITQEWLNANNAKTGACDKTNGENYITECADNFNGVQRTTGNKQGYEKCEKSGNAQPTIPERKYHDACTAEETAKIPNAATSWWYNGKCVAKSCKPNTYLHVKNGVSQGQCMTACPAWQITDWANGGQACDVAKTKPVEPTPAQERCARVQQVAVNDPSCKSQCAKFATDNKCLWNQEYLWKNDICICTPNQSDRNTVLNIGNVTPSAPVQENDTTTVVKPDYVEPIVAPAKPGRDMGGAALYYKQAVKGQDINPYVEIDGKKYQGYATPGYPRAQRALENLRKKLEDAGYSNFNLVAGY